MTIPDSQFEFSPIIPNSIGDKEANVVCGK